MGAEQAFDRSRANFDGMIVQRPEAAHVYLSSVRHETWMEVSEEGTEAAAVTASVHYTVGCSAEEPPMPAEFHADRPFLYFIVHNPSRSILFAGWIGNPAELEASATE
jgi:serpin B